MASPFAVFRKHKTALFAGLTIMTMFAFVVIPPLLQLLGVRGGPSGTATAQTVVESKYGNLTRQDVQRLVAGRRVARSFIEQAWLRKYMEFQAGHRTPESEYVPQLVHRDLDRSFPLSERAVVDVWMLAHRAAELGIVVSEKAVQDFANMLVSYLVQRTTRDFSANVAIDGKLEEDILKNLGANDAFLADALRREIAAERVSEMLQISLGPVPPAKRWDYFEQAKRAATVELAGLEVAKLVDQVPDPSEAELKKFFNEHKDALPDPTSPQPGFREPHRATIEYFKAVSEKFVDPGAVTDEEIRGILQRAQGDVPAHDDSVRRKPSHAQARGETRSQAGHEAGSEA